MSPRAYRITIAATVVVCSALLLCGGYFVFGRLTIAAEDDAVRIRLRNISALADEYFSEHGVTSVHVSQLDQTKVRQMGIGETIEQVRPLVIQKGHWLEAPSLDGKRTIRITR